MGKTPSRRQQAARIVTGVAALAATLALAATTASGDSGHASKGLVNPPVPPYGVNDAGGFRNVLPPGENGTDNAVEFARWNATGEYPDHWVDQQPLYDNLIQGAESLTNSKIGKYYKDATFGVRPPDVESTTEPKPGVTILRDKQYGIPHIYGKTRYDAMFGTGMLPVGDHTRGEPTAPDFFSGWWGYVSKDLRDLFGPKPKGAWSRVYCGHGKKHRCRQALRSSLRKALKVSPATLYGHGDCAGDPDAQCYDQNRSVITSGISIPPAPFQNRPTFQQTVSVKRNLP